jgi:hypothetical protein
MWEFPHRQKLRTFFKKNYKKMKIVKKWKKVKVVPFTFLSILGNFFVVCAAMFVHSISINTCPLTFKTLITLVLTIYSLPTYLPAWVFRLFRFCLSVFPQKSYFFSHLFYFFFSFLVSFLQFFYFYLVLELFIDDLEIIVMVCIIL